MSKPEIGKKRIAYNGNYITDEQSANQDRIFEENTNIIFCFFAGYVNLIKWDMDSTLNPQ